MASTGAPSISLAEAEALEARKALEAAESRAAARASSTPAAEDTIGRLPVQPAPQPLPAPLYREPSDLSQWGANPDVDFELSLPSGFGRPQQAPAHGSKDADDDDEDDDLQSPPNDPFADGMGPYLKRSLYELLLTSKMNLLILCTPVAYWGVLFGASDTFVFTFSLLAIAPFAERLSYVTEQLALHTSQTLGGLLNATFGNVTELIVSLFALRAGLLRIVQVSLLGSILSNLLLVLGTAFLVGGIKYPSQVLARLSTLGTDLALSMTCDL